MKLPTKKDIIVAALCVVVPGAIMGAIVYYFLKDKLNNVKKTTIKKSKDQKTNKSTAGKRR